MSAEKLLSIVTVTYNDRKALAYTLESCRSQVASGPKFELIVIDGASTDGSDELVRQYGDIVSIFVSEPDRGIYDAMNKGLNASSAKYVMYLNAGDVWSDSTALQLVLASLADVSPKWLIGGALSLEGGKRERIVKNIPHSWVRHALGLQAHCHQSTIIERSLMMSVGGFSEDYEFAGDFDIIFRIGLIAKPAYMERVIVIYAGGGVSALNANRISYLQRKVRADRMQLGPLAEALNSGYMRYHFLRRKLISAVIYMRRLRSRTSGHVKLRAR